MIGCLCASLPPTIASATDDFDYRNDLDAPIWIHDWSDWELTQIPGWGDWPLHLVNTRAHVIDESYKHDIDDITSSECKTLTEILVPGVRYRWPNAKSAHADTFEETYAHTTDPASLTLRQSAGDAVTLHWELDSRRYVLIHEHTWNDRAAFTDFITSYKVLRKAPGETDFTEFGPFSYVGPGAEWTDGGLSTAGDYVYKVVSEIEPGLFASFSHEQTIQFTPEAPAERAFWIESIWGEHPEPHDESPGSHTLHVELSAYTGDGSVPDLTCNIRWPRTSDDTWGVDGVPLVHVHSQAGTHDYILDYTWSESDDIHPADDPAAFTDSKGAFVCSFHEVIPGGDPEPLFGDDWFTTAPNNRLRNVYWYSYLVDVTEPESVTAFALRANEVLTPEGASGVYDGIFGDTADDYVLGYWGAEPHDYDSGAYPQQVADYLRDVRLTDAMGGRLLVVNGVGKEVQPKYAEVDGVVYEQFVSHRGRYCVEGPDVYHGNEEATDGDIWSGGQWLCNMSYFMSIYEVPGLEAYAWPCYEEANTRARLFTYASFLVGAAAANAMDRSFYAPIQYRDPTTNDAHLQFFAEQMLGMGAAVTPFPTIPVPGNCDETPTKDLGVESKVHPCDDLGDCSTYTDRDLIEGYFDNGIVLVNYNHWCLESRADRTYSLPPGETYHRLHVDGKQIFDGGRFWTEPVSGSIDVHPLTAEFLMKDPIASPVVAAANAHPIHLDFPSLWTLSLEASHWDGQPLWIEVDASPLSPLLTDHVPLLDGDGDGFYDSGLIDVTVPAGIYELSYYAWGSDGLGLYDTFAVVVDERNAFYENKSPEVAAMGLDYAGTPYGSVTFDYDGDGDEDLLVTQKDQGAQLYEMQDLVGGVPVFYNMTLNEFPPGLPGQSCRGISPADIDNDRREDLFIAHADAGMLLVREWDPENLRWVYRDRTETFGLSSYSSESWSGSWADYDRDNDLDLYITRAQAVGPDDQDPHYGNLVPLQDILLRNDLSESLTFVDRSMDVEGLEGSANMSVAAAWGDMDSDGDPDLFVPSLDQMYPGQELSRLYVNMPDGTFTEEFASRFGSPSLYMASGACWTDVDNDGDLDLACSVQDPMPTPRNVFINEGGGFSSVGIPVTIPASSVMPLDCNLDGRSDLLFAPFAPDASPRLLRNVDAGPVLYMDDTVATGLFSLGRVDGISVSDYGQDGDPDLFLGRHRNGSAFFYRAGAEVDMDGPVNNYIAVKLIPKGGNNASCIGTRVVAALPTGSKVQVVDGGSGRGGQQPRIIVFGTGDYEGDVGIDVYWPGGFHQSGPVPTGQVTDVPDQTTPEVVDDSLDVVLSLLPGGGVRWTCTWVSLYSSDPSLDEVLKINPDGFADLLSTTTPGASFKYSRLLGGGYLHTMVYEEECVAGTYHFRGHSATEIAGSWTDQERVTFRICPAGS